MMLQIASGKLFSNKSPSRRNEHRGVLHTNLRLVGESPIKTVAGNLLPVTTLHGSQAIVYEMTELMEAQADGPGILVSRGMDPYLAEFGAIASFALNVVCTTNAQLALRLLNDKQAAGIRSKPNKFVRRFFDQQVWCQDEDAEHLTELVGNLIALERRSYRAAIRAIHTYVTGLHRLADDLELAYTLLVASIESLAQGFDGHRATWLDFDGDKRKLIDSALVGASDDTTGRVRSALLDIEHTSLARRFQSFTLEHVTPAYFRDEASLADGPIGRAELPDALREAYRMRSKYIHNLDELPRIMTLGDSYQETVRPERRTMLTFQGLARLARFVITEFIRRQPRVESEIYDYSLEQSGVIQMRLAPQYWVGRVEGLIQSSGRAQLEGFLEQLTGHLLKQRDASVNDLRELFVQVEAMLPEMKVAYRRPFVALYLIFNECAPNDMRMPNYDETKSRYGPDLDGPSVESMLWHLVTSSEPLWPLSEHDKVHEEYFRGRERKSGLRVPRTLEAGISLTLAERHRKAGDSPRALGLVGFAVENHPGHGPLRTLEDNFEANIPIDWHKTMLPIKGSETGQAV